MKKIFAMLVSLTLVACLSGCASSETKSAIAASNQQKTSTGNYTVGFCPMDLSNNFWAAIANSFVAAGKAAGVTTIVTDGKSDAATQVSALEDFISKHVNVIVVGPVDANSLKGVVSEAKKAGIPVITHTTKYDDATCNMNVDELQMGLANGTACGEWMAKQFGADAKCKYAILTQRSLEQTIGRENGIKQGIAKSCPSATCVTTVDAYTTDMGITAAENILSAHPDIVAIEGINDSGCLGAYQAAKARGVTDKNKFYIGGNDGTDQALQLISQGTIYQDSVYLNPVGTGKQFIDYALDLKSGKTIPSSYMIPVSAITPANVSDYLKK